jgi:hypothetical protein
MPPKCCAAVVCVFAFLAHADMAKADDRSVFVVEMTHAIYAKGLCRGVSMAQEDLVRIANAKSLNPIIVEDVMNAVVFINSKGKKGAEAPQDVMVGVTVAANVIAADQSKIGTSAWCEARTPSLLKDRFIRFVEPTTTDEHMNARLDEQLAGIKK